MGTHFTHVKDYVRDRSASELMGALMDLYPESQEARAAAVGVGQSSIQRWEAELEAGEMVSAGPSSLVKLRQAVERAENLRPDYVRGVKDGIVRLERVLKELRGLLPQGASDALALDAANEAKSGLGGKRNRGKK